MNLLTLLRGHARENDALEEARAERSCSMGVGCGTAGVCYAAAHGRPHECPAKQFSDQMVCDCRAVWDVNDPHPPECRRCSGMGVTCLTP
jgi:hypothetical protein